MRGHSCECKESREQNKRDQGQCWKQQQALWQTSTTTSTSGSRRSACQPHCFISVTPTALPISCKGEEQLQAIKITELRKLQTTDCRILRNTWKKKEALSIPRRTIHTKTRRSTTGQSEREGQRKHISGQNGYPSAGGQKAEDQVLPKLQQMSSS